MIQGNYEKIIEKIARFSGLTNEEVERKVEAKKAKLSGMVTKEGAIQIVASELGVSFDNEKLKLEELLPGMRKVNVVGKVINIYPVRNFYKNGKDGKVANLVIADETSNVKVVLWDTHHIELIEKKQILDGSVIEIFNASVRDNELHLGSFSELKPSVEIFENVKSARIFKNKNISDFKIGESNSVRAFIVQSFDPRFFNVCPECKKKPNSEGEDFVCTQHGKIIPEKRALINLVIDDGTETIRSVIFHDSLGELGIKDLDNPERLSFQKEDLLGKEMIFHGNVRLNKFFNNNEFNIDKVEAVDLNSLIESLEKG